LKKRSDIHIIKYSGAHESFVKMIKNVGWPLFSKTLAGKELSSLDALDL